MEFAKVAAEGSDGGGRTEKAGRVGSGRGFVIAGNNGGDFLLPDFPCMFLARPPQFSPLRQSTVSSSCRNLIAPFDDKAVALLGSSLHLSPLSTASS
ncbi:unnamed protein product [Linum trigynum]|uniref:Uncharacterized protein n=1 Tax=Linum trigynum TaxID=586398 RepID=A0AAV2D988_9ROSI